MEMFDQVGEPRSEAFVNSFRRASENYAQLLEEVSLVLDAHKANEAVEKAEAEADGEEYKSETNVSVNRYVDTYEHKFVWEVGMGEASFSMWLDARRPLSEMTNEELAEFIWRVWDQEWDEER